MSAFGVPIHVNGRLWEWSPSDRARTTAAPITEQRMTEFTDLVATSNRQRAEPGVAAGQP